MSEASSWASVAVALSSAMISFVLFKRTMKASNPTIEHSMEWITYPRVGQILQVDFDITNNMNRSIEIESVSIVARGNWRIISNIRNTVDFMYNSGKVLNLTKELQMPMRLMRMDGGVRGFDENFLPSRMRERIYVLPPDGFSAVRSSRSLAIKIRCARSSFPIFNTFRTAKYSIPQQEKAATVAQSEQNASDGG